MQLKTSTKITWLTSLLCFLSITGVGSEEKFVDEYVGEKGVIRHPAFEPGDLNKALVHRTWRITADKIQRLTNRNIEATGKVTVMVHMQNAMLEADEVVYDPATTILAARGRVKIVRKGMMTKVMETRFKIASPEFLVTESDVGLSNPLVILN